jgi:hypothetical protein
MLGFGVPISDVVLSSIYQPDACRSAFSRCSFPESQLRELRLSEDMNKAAVRCSATHIGYRDTAQVGSIGIGTSRAKPERAE